MVALRPVGVDPAARHAVQRMPRARMDDREIEVSEEQHEGDLRQPIVDQNRLSERKRVSRSPSHKSMPVTAKRIANAAVIAALSFWPALNLPWGRSAAQPVAIVAIEDVDLAQRSSQ